MATETAAQNLEQASNQPAALAPAERRRVVERYLTGERSAMLISARKLAGTESEAEELVQATALRCLVRAERLRHAENLRGWVNQTMTRLFIDQWRRDRRVRHDSGERAWQEAEVRSAGPLQSEEDPCAWEWVTMADVRRALAELTPAQREAFELFTFSGLSYEDLAMRLGIPLRTAGTRLLRARSRLRVLLAASVPGGGRLVAFPVTAERATVRRRRRPGPQPLTRQAA